MVPRWPQELTAIIYKIEIRFFLRGLKRLITQPQSGHGIEAETILPPSPVACACSFLEDLNDLRGRKGST